MVSRPSGTGPVRSPAPSDICVPGVSSPPDFHFGIVSPPDGAVRPGAPSRRSLRPVSRPSSASRRSRPARQQGASSSPGWPHFSPSVPGSRSMSLCSAHAWGSQRKGGVPISLTCTQRPRVGEPEAGTEGHRHGPSSSGIGIGSMLFSASGSGSTGWLWAGDDSPSVSSHSLQ